MEFDFKNSEIIGKGGFGEVRKCISNKINFKLLDNDYTYRK